MRSTVEFRVRVKMKENSIIEMEAKIKIMKDLKIG